MKATCQELSEVKFKNELVIRELQVKLVGAEEVSERPRQTLCGTLQCSSTH